MRRLALLTCFFVVGCFDGGSQQNPDSGALPDAAKPVKDGGSGTDAGLVEAGTETWTDGKTIDASILVPSGATVTIAPGATITVADGVLVRVEGSLVASSAQTHAKLQGSAWSGILVASHGVVTLDGVDIAGATTALDLEGDGKSTYDHGVISDSTPFVVAAGASLSTSHASVQLSGGITTVSGSFTASYLDYDSNDHGAFVTLDPAAYFFMEDSTIHNSGPLGSKTAPDQLTNNGAATFHVAYTDISGAHCGFHFENAGAIDIDHVTVHDVTNGADLWGTSSSGTITSSNWQTLTENFDESKTNAVISVTNCYTTGTNKLIDGQVQISSPSATAITGAGPR